MRRALAVAITAVGAFFIGCGQEGTTPTDATAGSRSDDTLAIEGYTYYGGERTGDVDVKWYCDTCGGLFLGGNVVDAMGYYRITTDDPWDEHKGHTLRGEAVKVSPPAGDTRYIYNFNWGNIPYRVDFYLE